MGDTMTVRTITEARSGLKYIAVPDIIKFLNENSKGESEETKKFVHTIIVNISTGEDL